MRIRGGYIVKNLKYKVIAIILATIIISSNSLFAKPTTDNKACSAYLTNIRPFISNGLTKIRNIAGRGFDALTKSSAVSKISEKVSPHIDRFSKNYLSPKENLFADIQTTVSEIDKTIATQTSLRDNAKSFIPSTTGITRDALITQLNASGQYIEELNVAKKWIGSAGTEFVCSSTEVCQSEITTICTQTISSEKKCGLFSWLKGCKTSTKTFPLSCKTVKVEPSQEICNRGKDICETIPKFDLTQINTSAEADFIVSTTKRLKDAASKYSEKINANIPQKVSSDYANAQTEASKIELRKFLSMPNIKRLLIAGVITLGTAYTLYKVYKWRKAKRAESQKFDRLVKTFLRSRKKELAFDDDNEGDILNDPDQLVYEIIDLQNQLKEISRFNVIERYKINKQIKELKKALKDKLSTDIKNAEKAPRSKWQKVRIWSAIALSLGATGCAAALEFMC